MGARCAARHPTPISGASMRRRLNAIRPNTNALMTAFVPCTSISSTTPLKKCSRSPPSGCGHTITNVQTWPWAVSPRNSGLPWLLSFYFLPSLFTGGLPMLRRVMRTSSCFITEQTESRYLPHTGNTPATTSLDRRSFKISLTKQRVKQSGLRSSD